MYEHDGLQILAFSCIIIQLEASRTKHTHTQTRMYELCVQWKLMKYTTDMEENKSAKSRMEQILFPAQV